MGDNIVEKSVGNIEKIAEKVIAPAAGVGGGWFVGDMLLKKVDIPARLAFAVPSQIAGAERQDVADTAMLVCGVGSLLLAATTGFKAFSSKSDWMERAMYGVVAGIAGRLGIEFLNDVSNQ